jgi:Uma2 family endonuclease
MNIASPLHSTRQPARFTKAEYLDLVGIGAYRKPYECELVEGELVRMNAVCIGHQRMADHVFLLLHAVITANVLNAWVVREPIIDVGPETIRQADVGVFRPLPEGTKAAPADAALLVVEVADTTLRTDLGDKLLDYASAEIAEYLVVDIKALVVHVCRKPVDGDYTERLTVPFGTAFDVLGQHLLTLSKP